MENKEEVSYDEEMEYFANEIEEDVDTVKKIIQGFFVRYHTNPNFYELEEEARNRNNENKVDLKQFYKDFDEVIKGNFDGNVYDYIPDYMKDVNLFNDNKELIEKNFPNSNIYDIQNTIKDNTIFTVLLTKMMGCFGSNKKF